MVDTNQRSFLSRPSTEIFSSKIFYWLRDRGGGLLLFPMSAAHWLTVWLQLRVILLMMRSWRMDSLFAFLDRKASGGRWERPELHRKHSVRFGQKKQARTAVVFPMATWIFCVPFGVGREVPG